MPTLGLARKANKTKHDKNAKNIISLNNLAEQISKELSQYSVAQGSFWDVWKCIRKPEHPQITVEVAAKCLRLKIPHDSCKTKITKGLEHANLLSLLGITQGFGPLPAIVSPWMHKDSLTTLLECDYQHLTHSNALN